jgi:DNA-binding CsgD family transcriptional regulator
MALPQYDRFTGAGVDEFIVAIGRASDTAELSYRAKDIAERYFFDFFCLLRLPIGEGGLQDGQIVCSNITADIPGPDAGRIATLIEHAAREARHSTEFMHLDVEDDTASGLAARRAGIGDAWFFPVHAAAGATGLAGFFGARRPGDLTRMLELNYLSGLLFDRFEALGARRYGDSRLSRRETECLNWTSEGKTSAEIAKILGLSEHTVNNYLVAACLKLDTVNRVHAVATAIRRGIIA